MDALPAALQPYVPLARNLLIAAAILAGGWIVSKWVQRIVLRAFSHRALDAALGRFMAQMARYTLLAATVITALGAVGIQTTTMVAVFASAGLAIGLALQGSLASFASGVMILLFRPFTLGDKVTAAGQTGVVSDVGLFATTIVTADNETIIVPNSAVTSGTIVNFNAIGTLRAVVPVTVAYGADPARVMDVLRAAARRAELVLATPGPAVAFTGLSARGLEFAVMAWANAGDYLAVMHNVRHAAYDDLRAAGVAFPSAPVLQAVA